MKQRAAASAEPRYRPPEVRGQQILDAAAALAIGDGLESTSIAKVAAEAGVAKGAIYLHFASRGDLIAGLQARVWAQMMDQPRVVAADDALPWAERLDAVVAHWMRFELENQSLYHAVFHTVPTESDESLEEARQVLADLLPAPWQETSSIWAVWTPRQLSISCFRPTPVRAFTLAPARNASSPTCNSSSAASSAQP